MRAIHWLLLLVPLLGLCVGAWIVHELRSGSAPREVSVGGSSASASTKGSAADLLTRDDTTQGSRDVVPPPSPVALDEVDLPTLSIFHGRLVNPSGNPVPDAVVYFASTTTWRDRPLDSSHYTQRGGTAPARTQSNDDGRFQFEVKSHGAYRIAVRAKGYAPYDEERLVLRPGEQGTETIVLSPGVVLEGLVVDLQGPVTGAAILRPDPLSGQGRLPGGPTGAPLAVTGDDGTFRLDTLAPGPWSLLVQTETHPDAYFEGETIFSGEHRGGLVFELQPGEVITGFVRTVGAPLGKWLVVAQLGPVGAFEDQLPTRPRVAQPNQDGSFELYGLMTGCEYNLRVIEATEPPWSASNLVSASRVKAGTTGVELVVQQTASIVCRVLDDRGSPIQDFVLRIEGRTTARGGQAFRDNWEQEFRSGDGRLSRDASGRIRVPPLQRTGGPYSLRVQIAAEGFRTVQQAGYTLPEGGELDLGDFRLARAPSVLAVAVDGHTGKAIEGATIHLRDLPVVPGNAGDGALEEFSLYTTGQDQATTNSKGEAQVSSQGSRGALVWATHEDYAPTWPLACQPLSRERVQLKMRKGGRVEVSVFDTGGKPFAGAEVAIDYRPRRDGPGEPPRKRLEVHVADELGKTTFEHLVPAAYSFSIVDEQANRISYGAAVDEQRVQVTEGETKQVSLSAPATGTLSGMVSEGGRALAGATVVLRPKNEDQTAAFTPLGDMRYVRATTYQDGRFVMRSIRTGNYRLAVQHPSRAMEHEMQVDVFEGENALNIFLPTTLLAGRVVDESGRSVAQARLEVRMKRRAPSGPSANSVLSEEDGSYVLRGLVSSEWLELEVEASGYQPMVLSDLRLGPDEVRSSFDIHLQSAGTIEVTVLDSSGRPADRCLVRLRKLSGDSSGKEDDRNPGRNEAKLTDSQGRVVFEGLTPGSWKAEARGVNATRDPLAEGVFSVRAHENTFAELHLR